MFLVGVLQWIGGIFRLGFPGPEGNKQNAGTAATTCAVLVVELERVSAAQTGAWIGGGDPVARMAELAGSLFEHVDARGAVLAPVRVRLF